jgi:hypothetical protein
VCVNTGSGPQVALDELMTEPFDVSTPAKIHVTQQEMLESTLRALPGILFGEFIGCYKKLTPGHDGGSWIDCGFVAAELLLPVALKAISVAVKELRVAMVAYNVAGIDAALASLKVSAINLRTLAKLQKAALAARTNALVDAFRTCIRTHSFAAGTGVLMADGSTKPIEDVRAGDWVRNAAPGGGVEVHRVTEVHVSLDDTEFTDVTVVAAGARSTITGTRNHPYYDLTRHDFVEAGRLAVGDRLQTGGPEVATVEALRDYSGAMVTYDLTIEGIHTYYVGADAAPVLVHNTVPCGVALDALSAIGRQPYSGKLTQAGYSYRKHMDKGQLPTVPKVPEQSLNDAGQSLLDDILTDPHSQFIQYPDGRLRVISNSIVNPWKGPGAGNDYFIGVTFRSDGSLHYFGVYN